MNRLLSMNKESKSGSIPAKALEAQKHFKIGNSIQQLFIESSLNPCISNPEEPMIAFEIQILEVNPIKDLYTSINDNKIVISQAI